MTVDSQASRKVVDLITGAWRTQALSAAVALDLPDYVHNGTVTSKDLAIVTGVDEGLLRRLMRLLAALGVFYGEEQSGYRSTAVSLALLRDHPNSLRDMCLLYGEEFYWAWGHARDTVHTGRPGFEVSYGESLISYLSKDANASARFQRAMKASNFFFDDVPNVFDFSGASVIVDLGGGNGQLLSTILQAAPEARGVLVDLEHMLPVAGDYLRDTVGRDRVELEACSIFDAVPPGGDVYLLSRVLGDWDDESSVKLLWNCRKAMSDSSRLVVLERIVEGNEAVLPALWDMHLLMLNGGSQRSMDEYVSLFERADLRIEEKCELSVENSALIVAPGSA